MLCTQCNEHILATTNIAWNKGDYHPDCIGQAVLDYRAAQERMNNPLTPSDYEAFEDEEMFEDEYGDYQADDDLDDLVERLDNMPEVSDEILNQIPAQMPDYRPEVHINEVVANVSNQFAADRQGNGYAIASKNGPIGTLISGNTTTLINRNALKHLPMPEATATHQPIAHHALVEQIHESLSYRRLQVVREEYAVSPDGMKIKVNPKVKTENSLF